MDGRRPPRVAVVGAGQWGRRILATLAEMPSPRLVVVASGNVETCALLPAGVAVVPDWRGLFTRDDLDGLIVATPPSTHDEIVAMAVEAGLGVLVEKPLTPDLASTLALVGRVSGDRVLVDHIHLFHTAYEVLRELLAGVHITGVLSEGGAPGPLKADPAPLWEYGPHDAALVLDLLGEVHVTSAQFIERAIPGGIGEVWQVEAVGAGGASVRIVTGNGFSRKRRRLLVATESERYVLDDRAALTLVRHAPGPLAWPTTSLGTSVPVEDQRTPLNRVLDSFARGLLEPSVRDRRWGFSLPVAVAQVLETAAARGVAAHEATSR